MSKKLYTHEDLVNSTFKVEWLNLKYDDGTLSGSFRILSVGTTYYVTDMTNMLRDKLKSLSDKYEYLSKAEIIFPPSISDMDYGFYIQAKLKQSGGGLVDANPSVDKYFVSLM